jgi:alanine dehydrogenase
MYIITEQEMKQLLTPELAVTAIESALALEAEGKAVLPARLNVEFETGWLRMMPGAFQAVDEWGVMGCKVMNLDKKRGLHYLILLYSIHTGELLAMMDGASITQIRTGAVSTVVAKKTVKKEIKSVGIIGTGYEARGQLLTAHSVFPIRKATVFSRNRQNRQEYAEEMSNLLHIDVQPVATAEEAAADQDLLIMATKSPVPVIDGNAIKKDAVVLSIGSTRIDLRELDLTAIERASWIVVDNKEQVIGESADIQEAFKQGVLKEDQFVEAHNLDRVELVKHSNKDLIIFKSSGTALQDLSVALKIYQAAKEQGLGIHLEGFPYLKKFK